MKQEKGLTLVEVMVVAALIAIIAILLYLPYRGTYRSYHTGSVETNIQENTRIAMKRIIKELGAGMVIIPEDSNDAQDGSINYGYTENHPYKIAIYLPDSSNPKAPGDIITLYAALPENSTNPLDPAQTSPENLPLLYIRRYNTTTLSWENPECLIRPENDLKVIQLNFIPGGDNRDKVIITLELTQREPLSGNWRSYKLTSSLKLGAR